MSEHSTHSNEPREKPNGNPKDHAVKEHRRRIFYGSFWSDHPVSILGLLLGGILVSPITDFPGGDRKGFWYVISGLAVLLLVVIYWFVDGLLKLKIPTEEEVKLIEEREEDEYRQRLETKLGVLDSRLQKTEQVIASHGPRALSLKQSETITKALSPFKGQKVCIMALLFDTEASRYAADFIRVLTRAGWDFCGKGIINSTFPLDFDNADIYISLAVPTPETIHAAVALKRVLAELGIVKNDDLIRQFPDLPKDQIQVRIGARPVPVTPYA